ncbi:MAG: hypothetical protein AMXMBFR13_07580 [Phycisphaerae bacterium]
MSRYRHTSAAVVLLSGVLMIAAHAGAQPAADHPAGQEAGEQVVEKSMLDVIRAGGAVGYLIILLSVAGVALTIDAFLKLKAPRLLPPVLVDQADQLTRQGKFAELMRLCQASDSMLGRILSGALARGTMGLPAVREAMQDLGARETTRLQQRIGYVGFIASVAPMLGLLGTVTGMIKSFNVLGMTKGAARPDELAIGIAEALVTTGMGLVVAIPLMFCHAWLRDRLASAAQESAGLCERVLRNMAVVLETRQATPRPAQQEATVGAGR